MRRLLTCLLVAGTALPVAAQSPLTTLYNGAALLSAPTVYFNDVVLNAPLQFHQVDVNTNSAIGTPGSIDVYWIANTWVGNELTPAAWTLGSSAPVVSSGSNVPTVGVLSTPFVLPPGNYGIAIAYNGISAYYSSDTGLSYSTAEMTLLTGGGSANGAFGTAICCQPRTWNGSFHYTGSGAGTVATKTTYGAGCYLTGQSFYELFAPTTVDLSNTSLMMVSTGSGYLVTAGTNNWFTPTSTPIALTDDSVSAAQNLPFIFNFPGGSTNSVWISSNGFVWLAASTVNDCCNGTVATLLSNLPRICLLWGDLNPGVGGTVNFDIDPNNTAAYVTFTQVPEYGQTASLNTMQLMIDQNGLAELRYQTCSALTHTVLAGFSPGGGTIDTGNRDLTAAVSTPFVTGPEQLALALDASARPVSGTSLQLVTTNVPASSTIGVTAIGLQQVNPGLELSLFGMPGCYQNASLGSINVFVAAGGSGSYPLSIPNNPGLHGLHVFAQSVMIAPGSNSLGLITSNGVDLRIGNL